MASGWTNRGKFTLLDIMFDAASPPTNYGMMLMTSAGTPDVDDNTVGTDLNTEIAAGFGYTTGGTVVTPATEFTVTEDDTLNLGSCVISDQVWTASGGPIPSSGDGARWAILTDDNGTIGSRIIYAWFDLSADRTVSDGQTLTLTNATLQTTTP